MGGHAPFYAPRSWSIGYFWTVCVLTLPLGETTAAAAYLAEINTPNMPTQDGRRVSGQIQQQETYGERQLTPGNTPRQSRSLESNSIDDNWEESKLDFHTAQSNKYHKKKKNAGLGSEQATVRGLPMADRNTSTRRHETLFCLQQRGCLSVSSAPNQDSRVQPNNRHITRRSCRNCEKHGQKFAASSSTTFSPQDFVTKCWTKQQPVSETRGRFELSQKWSM